MCCKRGVSPCGIAKLCALFPSWTRTSAWPKFSLRRVVSALTAELRSRTTIASAKEPSADAVAASHPASIRMRDAIEPNIEIPRESRTSAAPPSRLLDVIRIASSFDSVAFFSRSVLRSRSIRSECFFFAASNSRFACSKSESSPCSPASAPAISISRVEYSRDALSTRA